MYLLVFCCILFCVQSYQEINIYFKKQIFTTSTIEELSEGPITLTFCGSPPILQKNITIQDLQKSLVWPNSEKIILKKILTLYRGTCLSIEADFLRLVESNYLFYDWGKK